MTSETRDVGQDLGHAAPSSRWAAWLRELPQRVRSKDTTHRSATPVRAVSSGPSPIVTVAIIALVYWAVGRLSLNLAIPPGYASAVWPPAGIALVGTLVFGRAALPGVFLGSFLVNVGLSLSMPISASTRDALIIGSVFGVGATVQAAAGARLLRRFVGYPTALMADADIVRFLLLSGPVSCLVGASSATTTLVLLRYIDTSSFALAWWTWWVGDTIGVLVLAPILFCYFGKPRDVWKKRRRTVALPLIAGFSVVVAFFVQVRSWQQDRVASDFEKDAHVLTRALERHLDHDLDFIRTVGKSFEQEEEVSPRDFHALAGSFVRHPAIRAIGWATRVAPVAPSERGEGRDAFELSMVEPADDASRAALALATISDRAFEKVGTKPIIMTAASRLRPDVQESDVIVLAPVRETRPAPGMDATTERLKGIVVARLELDRVAEIAWHGLDVRGINVWLHSAVEPEISILRRADGASATVAARVATDFGGEPYEIEFMKVASSLRSARGWHTWPVLAGGLLFLSFLGGGLLSITARTIAAVEGERRTAALAASLRESEERLRAAQQIGHIGTFDWNIETGVNEWTPELEAMYGLAAGTFPRTQAAWEDLVHPDDRAEAVRRIERALDTGETTDGEWRVVWPDGSTHWLAGRFRAVRDESGKPIRLLGINIDLTDRKRADAERERLLDEISAFGRTLEARVTDRTNALELARSRLEGIIGIATDAIISTDEDSNIRIFNKGAEEIFGFSRDEVIGRPVEILMPFRFRNDHRSRMAAFAGEAGVARRMGERRTVFGLRKTGEEFPAEAAISKLKTPGGHIFTAILRDVSERRRLEAERERASEEKGVLLREIHHRVKNNLQVISSLFYLQARRTTDRQTRELLDESRSRIQSIALVHDQLYRSPTLEKIDLQEYLTNLAHTIRGIVASTTPQIDVKAEGVSLDIERAIPCGLIVGELLTNALKHAFPRGDVGLVEVRVNRKREEPLAPEEIVIEVIDDGIGLVKEWRRGITLGLQLVQSLTRQLNGSVTLEPTAGTHFTIRFPAPEAARAPSDHT